MSAKRVVRDLISNLPDEILGKILSYLPTRVGASTSVLSKRWRNLLGLVDNLDLREAGGCPLGFSEFVDKTLALFNNPCSMIKRFHLNCEPTHEKSRINGWIRTVLERGILEARLETTGFCILDTEFFTSNKLIELTICGGFYPQGLRPPGNVFFPALKRLSLVSAFADYFDIIISGCPVLEELFIYDANGPPDRGGRVLSPSIKRLTINHDCPDYQARLNLTQRWDWERWEWESISDTEDEYEDYFHYCPNDDYDITGLVKVISNVKTLHLSSDSLEVLYGGCYSSSMPVFHNLLTLSFESGKERSWQVVPLLLNSSPNLHTLVIKGLVHKVTSRCGDACICITKTTKKKKKKKQEGVCCLTTCQVKVLKILGYRGTCREQKQMSYFLANLKRLETVKVGIKVDHREDNDTNDTYLRITNGLMKLPRVSSNCRIHIL